jgi:hypothetical protein
VKDDPPPEHDTSAPDVNMDTGAHQDAPDTGANASGVGTTEDAGASNKSSGTDKGKDPEVPEIQSDPAPAAPGQAMSAAPEKPAPKTLALEKTTATPAKTGTPVANLAPTFKMTKIIKTALVPAKAAPPSSAMTLHTGKGATRVSSFHTLELEGRVSLRTKSDNSLGSLKEYCTKWNDADFVDTASSIKKKTLTGTPAPSNPDVIPAKPVAIASELFSIQQGLYRLAEATNLSILLISPQSPKMSAVRDADIRDFPISLLT